jgi:hypothetical protein
MECPIHSQRRYITYAFFNKVRLLTGFNVEQHKNLLCACNVTHTIVTQFLATNGLIEYVNHVLTIDFFRMLIATSKYMQNVEFQWIMQENEYNAAAAANMVCVIAYTIWKIQNAIEQKRAKKKRDRQQRVLNGEQNRLFRIEAEEQASEWMFFQQIPLYPIQDGIGKQKKRRYKNPYRSNHVSKQHIWFITENNALNNQKRRVKKV